MIVTELSNLKLYKFKAKRFEDWFQLGIIRERYYVFDSIVNRNNQIQIQSQNQKGSQIQTQRGSQIQIQNQNQISS